MRAIIVALQKYMALSCVGFQRDPILTIGANDGMERVQTKSY